VRGFAASPRRRRRQPLPALAPLGRIYLWVARAHHAAYDRGWRSEARIGVPVISIGNVTAGGTGKTPAALWLTGELADRGHAVGIVSRGYRGRRAEDPLVVARDGRLLAHPSEAGDEPVMLAQGTAARVVTVGRDRASAARLARDAGADVLILDDGFQHRRLHRDLDIVLVDAADPFGGGRGLPAGLLREPPGALLRADLLLLTRCPPDMPGGGRLPTSALPGPLRELLSRAAPSAAPPVFATRHEPDALQRADGSWAPANALAGRRVLAVSGIGRPDDFVATLERTGAIVADHLAWSDHHRYDRADARTIEQHAARARAELIVTTSKDAVRWPAGAPRPAVLRIALSVPGGPEIVERVMETIRRFERLA